MSRIRLFLLAALAAVVLAGVVSVSRQWGRRRASDTTAEIGSDAEQFAPRRSASARRFHELSERLASSRAAADGGDARAAAEAMAALRLAEVQMIIEDEAANPVRLGKAVGQWAGEPAAAPARRLALDTLLKQADPMVRLTSLLGAAGAAAVPPEQDPLWPEVVKAAQETWNPKNILAGRDMIISESNLPSRALLVSSIARYAASEQGMTELTTTMKNGIRSDFIDVYRDAAAPQRADMEAAVRKISGDEAAELLKKIATAPGL